MGHRLRTRVPATIDTPYAVSSMERSVHPDEERLLTALHAAGTGAWDWDLELDRVTLAGPAEQLLGIDEDCFDGTRESFYCCVHPEDRAEVLQGIIRAINGTGPYEHDFRVVHPDGSVHWLLSKGRVTFAPDYQPVRLVGTLTDVTARKEAEIALRQTRIYLAARERWFRLLVENGSDAVAVVDSSGILRYLSPGKQRFLGYEPEDNLHKSTFNLIHPDDLLGAQVKLSAMLKEPGGQATHQCRMRHKNGNWTWIEARGVNLLHEPGIDGIVVNYRDITESKTREEEWNYIVGSAQCLLWYADVTLIEESASVPGGAVFDWKFRFPNEAAACNFLGLPQDPGVSLAQAWYECRLDEDKIRIDQRAAIDIRAGRDYEQDFRCRMPDGSIRWFYETVRIEEVGANRWKAVGTATDITSRKTIEASVADLNMRLQRAMAETHHRVKNNLQIVAALIELQADMHSEYVSTSSLKRIGQHIGALAALHDLLTHQAKSDGDVEMLPANALLERLIDLVRGSIGNRRIDYNGTDISISAQKGAALALLVNELISNAIKYGGDTITIALDSDGEVAQLRVDDNGPGFGQNFDPVVSANTGMELIENVGRCDLRGSIVYSTNSEGGAAVILTFPVEVRP